MKSILLILISIALFTTCTKDKPKRKANAEIFKFTIEKCGCCWGWSVKKGSDTLKIDVIPQGVDIPMGITSPIPVYIELGAKTQDCPVYDYYEVKTVEVMK